VLAGLASIATLPVAIFLTRFSERYELLHAGFAIPLGGALGILAIGLSRRARRRGSIALGGAGAGRAAGAGRLLGIAGLCLALSGLVSLGVYAILEYVGAQE
jgi:hypothetical protein